MTSSRSVPSSLRARLRRLLAWLGVVGATAAPVLAQTAPAPRPVPQHWISYAQLVGNQLQDSLSDPSSDAVVRLHARMQERMLSQSQPQPAPPLVVRVWIDASGRVERTEFASLGQPQADTDLRGVLSSQVLTEPPPHDMRQPLVLQLALGFRQ